jgi:hypothetical protein
MSADSSKKFAKKNRYYFKKILSNSFILAGMHPGYPMFVKPDPLGI